MCTASSILALAASVGLDPLALQAIVDRYSGFAAAGYDTYFGCRYLIGDLCELRSTVQLPFYTCLCTTGLLLTHDWVALDAQARVLEIDGWPIAGLHAAGEVTEGRNRVSYLSGCSLGKGVIFGRAAGSRGAEDVRQHARGTA